MNAADKSPDEGAFPAPQLPPNFAWQAEFVNEYARLIQNDEFDPEQMSDFAEIAYQHTAARDLHPHKAAGDFIKNVADWALETRRIASTQWIEANKTVPKRPPLDEAWINACADELGKRLPGLSRMHLEAQAIFLSPDEGETTTPEQAATTFVTHFKPDGGPVPF